MALITKTIAEKYNGTVYVLVRYQDTNELVEYVEWANHSAGNVGALVTKSTTGEVILNTVLTPVAANQINGSATFSGSQRFKLEEYNVSL